MTSRNSLAHSRGAGARFDGHALNTTTRQGGHSVAPPDEGCGIGSYREVTDPPPLVPNGSNGSEVSMFALVHVSRPGVHVGTEGETERRNNNLFPPPSVDVDPGPGRTDRCVQPAPPVADGCRHGSAFPNFAGAPEGAQPENPGTDTALGTVHAGGGGRPDLGPLLDVPSGPSHEQGPVRAARLSADDGQKSPTEGTPSSCTTPHDVHVLKDEERDQLREAPGLPPTSSNDVASPHVVSTPSSCACTGVFDSVTRLQIVDYPGPKGNPPTPRIDISGPTGLAPIDTPSLRTLRARVRAGEESPSTSHTAATANPADTLREAQRHGPLTEEAVRRFHEQELRELTSKSVRPRRTTRIGHVQTRDEHDDCFIRNSIDRDFLAVYITNPKRDGTASHDRYKHYCMASNLREAITLSVACRLKGMSKAEARVRAMDDINWDYEHGYILFPGNESLLEGHFVDARRLAHDHKINCHAETVPHAYASEPTTPADVTDLASNANFIDAIPELALPAEHDSPPLAPFDDGTVLSTSPSRDSHALDLHTTSPDHDTSTFGDHVPTLDGLDLAVNASTSASAAHETYTRLDEEVRVIRWLLDTGANESITNTSSILDRVKRRRIRLQGISEKPVIIDKTGAVEGNIKDTNGVNQRISLDDVCYSEQSRMNLLATSSLVDNGATVHLEKGNCYMRLSRGNGKATSYIPIEEENGLYIVRLEHMVPTKTIRKAYERDQRDASTKHRADRHGHTLATAATMDTWHRRLNHTDKGTLRVMYDRGVAEGWKIPGGKHKHDSKCRCDACSIARASSAATPNQRRFLPRYQRPFAQVSSDLKGPLPSSFGGFKYCVTFICESSRMAYTYSMRRKSETPSKLDDFLDQLRMDGYAPPSEIRTDMGSEYYVSPANTPAGEETRLSQFSTICKRHRIRHRVTPPNKSSLNGIVERHHRTIHEAANSYLYQARLSTAFWSYAIQHANYVKNRISHSKLGPRLTPYEIVHRRRPRYDRIKVFGCDMFEYIPGQTKIPGGNKARKLIYIGVPENSDTGYLGFDPETRTVRVAYDVTFDESFATRASHLRHFDRARQQRAHDIMTDAGPEDRLQAEHIRTLFSEEGHTMPGSRFPLERLKLKRRPRITDDDHEKEEHEDADRAAEPPVSAREGTSTFFPTTFQEEHEDPDQRKGTGTLLPTTFREGTGTFFPAPPRGKKPSPTTSGNTRTFPPASSRPTRRSPRLRHAASVGTHHGPSAHAVATSPPGSNMLSSGGDQGGVQGQQGGEPLGEKLLEMRKTEDGLKFLDNTTTVHGFMATQFSTQRLYDPANDSWHVTPKNDHEARSGKDQRIWEISDAKEMQALLEFGTYELTHKCPGRPMTTKMVRKIKTDDEGRVSRFKSRLVARGFLSRDGIEHDDDELYSPVMAMDSLRTLSAIAAGKGYKMQQCDISNAYLQGHLTDRDGNPRYIYLHDPLNRKDDQGRKLYLKLLRPLYGLRQSGRLFCNELHGHLMDIGFERMPTDKCLFVKRTPRREFDTTYHGDIIDEIFIGSYVDDIPSVGSSDPILKWFHDKLRERFTINDKDTGDIRYILGARVTQDLGKGHVSMDQTAAITSLAERFNLHNSLASSSTRTPMAQEQLPRVKQTDDESKSFPYLSAIGSLLHISLLTRPDISYAVGACARHGAAYGPLHIRAVKKIIKYLFITRNYGIVFKHSSKILDSSVRLYESGRPPVKDDGTLQKCINSPLETFCDADFAGDVTRRSTSGNISFLYGGPLRWLSQLQKLYALSTAESEIYSAVEAVKDAAHLKLHLSALGVRLDEPIPVYEDNAACRIMTAQQLKSFNRARHYTTRLGFLQDQHGDTFTFVPCDTENMIADAFTKSLPADSFIKFRDTMVHDITKL